MPRINHLNPPPNPFWDFVADMQDHPFFGAYAPRHGPPPAGNTQPAAAAEPSNTNEKQQEKQPVNAEDPPEVDPATLREQTQEEPGRHFRGRRRCGSGSDNEGENRRECPGRRGWGRHARRGWGGPGPFGPGFPLPGQHPFWHHGPHPGPNGPPPPPQFGPGRHNHDGQHHEGPQHHPHGPFGPRGPHGPHGPRGAGHHGHGRPSPPPGPPGGFDLGQFLNDLGTRIGMDLSGAAAGLGLDKFMSPNSSADADFEPKADIFDTPQNYIVHLSLPGAKKSDVGVDWDGEHSSLRIAGVVHRPEVDEAMLAYLAVDGRKRETGVFEKAIRLGTRRDPASIDVSGIKAKMTDGVLVITVPKTEKQHEKREVPIAKSETPSPVREVREKELLFDADNDHHMAEVEPEREVQLVDLTKDEPLEKGKGKQAEHEAERKSRESSGTVEAEAEPEQLPAYKPIDQNDADDWENFGSDEEGDFVKINVD